MLQQVCRFFSIFDTKKILEKYQKQNRRHAKSANQPSLSLLSIIILVNTIIHSIYMITTTTQRYKCNHN